PPGPTAEPRLPGWVDLHTHPMSYLGFGGKAIAGAIDVGSPLPVDAHCNHNVRASSMQEALGNDNATHGGFGLFDNQCGDDIRKEIVLDIETKTGALIEPENAHGSSDFTTWPAWNDILHQKMWIDWIRRTKDNGQRVMIALAVNNKTI